MTSDIELLQAEIDTLWLRDKRSHLVVGGLRPNGRFAPHLVIGVSSHGWTHAFGRQVSDALAAALRAEIAAEPPASDPAEPPTVLARCERLLSASLGPTELSGGLSWVIPPETTFPSSAEIQRSDNYDAELLLDQDIERLNWEAGEWSELLAGKLGPWAMAVIDRRVMAICHSARLTEQGAEAGVWTDPAFRGQGHAAAVTAAWAALLAPSGRHLFYSTNAANYSSQRVAARLHLRPIGRTWRLAPPLSPG